MKITTTLQKIYELEPCSEGWKKLLKHLGKTKADDEEFPMSLILESNDLDDCLWVLQSRPDLSRLLRLFSVKCARSVQHLMTDQRSIDAIDVAERHADGKATDKELDDARSASEAASAAAWSAARSAAGAAVWSAASAASAAASDAAPAAVWSAARAAAWDAVWSAAGDAASDAARAAAGAAASDAQEKMLRELLDTGEIK